MNYKRVKGQKKEEEMSGKQRRSRGTKMEYGRTVDIDTDKTN